MRIQAHQENLTSPLRSGLMALIVVCSLGGLLGCQKTLEETCEAFPALQGELHTAEMAFKDRASNRSLASVDPDDVSSDRDEWAVWTETMLKKTATASDAVATRHSRRAALVPLDQANFLLVEIHGWISQGNWKKADQAIVELKDRYQEAYVLGCK